MGPEADTNELEAILSDRAFLRRLARSLIADEHRAEDVVQEAWVRALERGPAEVGAARNWLARVVRNLASNQRGRELARPAVERRAALPEAAPAEEEEERDFELQSAVLAAVRGLRQPYRSTIHLRYWRGLSPRAIARELGLPEATVKTRLRRGLELLRADLDRRHDGDRRAWCVGLIALALPELLPGAGMFSGASIAQGLSQALKGTLLMNKPIAATLATVSLIALAAVAWYAADGGDRRSSGAEPVAPVRAAGEAHAKAPEGTSPADRTDESEPSLARSAAAAPAPVAKVAAPRSEGRIIGRVLDAEGRPIAGAQVGEGELGAAFFLSAVPLGAGTASPPATSAPDGRFSLPVAEDGPLTLAVSASGFAPFQKDVTGYYDLVTDAGDLVLERGVTLAGRVVDAAGAPVPGAAIHPPDEAPMGGPLRVGSGRGSALATSDAAGRFVVDQHAVGEWTLVARTGEHEESSASGRTARAGERVEDILIVLPQGATISGRVAGMPAQVVAAELEVRASLVETEQASGLPAGFTFFGEGVFPDRRASIGADGSFELRGLEPGRVYRLGVYENAQLPGARLYSRILELPSGSAGVELPWSVGASLAVQAVDASTGLPIEDFTFRADTGLAFAFLGAGEPTSHHPDGRARLDGLRVGEKNESATVGVSIAALGYAPWNSQAVVSRDRELDLGTVRLDPVPLLRVRVVDPAGQPVAGARVRLEADAPAGQSNGDLRVRGTVVGRSGGPARALASGMLNEGLTGEDGEVELSGLAGSRGQLSVEARRFAPFNEALDFPSQGALEREVRLERGAVAEVLAVGADGRPLADVRVQHRPSPGSAGSDGPGMGSTFENASRITDSEGRVYFRDLAPGKHGFRLDPGDGPIAVAGGRGGLVRMRTVVVSDRPDSSFTELEFSAGETRTLVLSAAQSSSVYGSVSEAGTPLEGAELRLTSEGSFSLPGLDEGGPSGTSDGRGRFTIDEVEPGEYELVVSHPARAMPHRQKLTVRPGGERVELDFDVTILEGRVTDTQGQPIAGARVRAERVAPEGRETRVERVIVMASASGGGGGSVVVSGADAAEAVETDADGHYSLRGVSSGVPIRVRAEAGGYSFARSESLELAPFEKRPGLDLELNAGGSLAVEVRQAGAVPQSPVLVRLEPADERAAGGTPPPKFTDSDGRAVFTELAAGLWSVTAMPIGHEGGEQTSSEFSIRAGEETPLRLDLP